MTELFVLRQELNTRQTRLAVAVGATVLIAAIAAAGDLSPIIAGLGGGIGLGGATYDGVKSHSIGQEIAAKEAILDANRPNTS